MSGVAFAWTVLAVLAAWVLIVAMFQPLIDQRVKRADRARRFLADCALWLGRRNPVEPPPVYRG